MILIGERCNLNIFGFYSRLRVPSKCARLSSFCSSFEHKITFPGRAFVIGLLTATATVRDQA